MIDNVTPTNCRPLTTTQDKTDSGLNKGVTKKKKDCKYELFGKTELLHIWLDVQSSHQNIIQEYNISFANYGLLTTKPHTYF